MEIRNPGLVNTKAVGAVFAFFEWTCREGIIAPAHTFFQRRHAKMQNETGKQWYRQSLVETLNSKETTTKLPQNISQAFKRTLKCEGRSQSQCYCPPTWSEFMELKVFVMESRGQTSMERIPKGLRIANIKNYTMGKMKLRQGSLSSFVLVLPSGLRMILCQSV